MPRRLTVRGALMLLGLTTSTLAQDAGPYTPTLAERTQVEARSTELAAAVEALRDKLGEGAGARDALADVEVCLKAAAFVARFGEYREPKDVARSLRTIETGLARARDLAARRTPWAEAVGSTVRGYRSRVDGSIQPYAIIVPAAGAGRGEDDRFRLDVVLHGRDARLQEARFFDAHDGKPAPADLPGLVLHVYGRGNNAYRWAGETDVHEAIEAVKRNYRVDHRRVVLRGFSMGGAGAWHLGLHDPSRWSSVEAGAGFTETIRYAHLENPSEVVRKGLHIYDAVDYARNAFGVPIAGYGGENDPQRQASMNIEDALVALGVTMKTDGLVTRAEGLDFVRIVGKGMGHAVDKESAGFLKAFHDRHAVKGSDLDASKIRFVTYTLKYPRVAWLSIARLREHYQPATLDAEITGDVATIKAENVAVLAVARQVAETVRLGTQEFPLRTAAEGLLPDVYFAKTDDGWALLDHPASIAIEENSRREKRPGLQGPIDDAFTGPFLCVRGTGTPWNPRVRAWALARLDRFTADWAKHFRGDLKIKNDVDVTDQDLQESHLILFGDPGSNRLIARMLPDLPVGWTREELRLAGSFPSVDHAPVFVTASPLNPLRYAVINGGHTFGAREFEGTNALLYPHLGDYAVFAIGEREEVRAGGYFNERWRLP